MEIVKTLNSAIQDTTSDTKYRIRRYMPYGLLSLNLNREITTRELTRLSIRKMVARNST